MSGEPILFFGKNTSLCGATLGQAYYSLAVDVTSYGYVSATIVLTATTGTATVSAQLEESPNATTWTGVGSAQLLNVGIPGNIVISQPARYVRLKVVVAGSSVLATLYASGVARGAPKPSSPLLRYESPESNRYQELVEFRKRQLIVDHIRNPTPPINPEGCPRPPCDNNDLAADFCVGHAAYAFAALKYGTQREADYANQLVNEVYSYYGTEAALKNPDWKDIESDPANPVIESLPLIWRLYCDPETQRRLWPLTRGHIEAMMWNLVYFRSKVTQASAAKAWVFSGTENKDAIRRSLMLIANERLVLTHRNPPKPLADGKFPEHHAQGWDAFFKEYFRQRAREGISCEYASPHYGGLTMYGLYLVRDFALQATTRRLAEQYLTLYWADFAQDMVQPTGVRGGAEARCAKNNALTYPAKTVFLRQIAWAYDFHRNAPGLYTLIYTLQMAGSSYVPPAIVQAMAAKPKLPYNYLSRRFGTGHGISEDPLDELSIFTFDNKMNAYTCRSTYWTPDFVMGASTVDPNQTYTAISRQNGLMGVMMSNSVNARVVVFGHSDVGDHSGHKELYGTCFDGCMVVGRDPTVDGTNGVVIFVSTDGSLWDNWEPADPNGKKDMGTNALGWWFTHSDRAFVAVRIASKPDGVENWYVKSDGQVPPGGAFLRLTDEWSPIVIQVVQSSRFDGDYEKFKHAVLSSDRYKYENSVLTYQSIRVDRLDDSTGHEFRIHRQSSTDLPSVDGVVCLNPTHTYRSGGFHGEPAFLIRDHRDSADTVTLSFPGFQALTLDFSYYHSMDDGHHGPSTERRIVAEKQIARKQKEHVDRCEGVVGFHVESDRCCDDCS